MPRAASIEVYHMALVLEAEHQGHAFADAVRNSAHIEDRRIGGFEDEQDGIAVRRWSADAEQMIDALMVERQGVDAAARRGKAEAAQV